MEWSGSLKVIASGSPNTVDASWKEMPCFLRLALDLSGSHSNFMFYFIIFLWSNVSDGPPVHLNYKHYTGLFSFVMKFWHILLLLQLGLDSSMRPAEAQELVTLLRRSFLYSTPYLCSVQSICFLFHYLLANSARF